MAATLRRRQRLEEEEQRAGSGTDRGVSDIDSDRAVINEEHMRRRIGQDKVQRRGPQENIAACHLLHEDIYITNVSAFWDHGCCPVRALQQVEELCCQVALNFYPHWLKIYRVAKILTSWVMCVLLSCPAYAPKEDLEFIPWRFIFTWLMIGGFCLIIYWGPLALMITVACVQVKVLFLCLFVSGTLLLTGIYSISDLPQCFAEIINIGYAVYKMDNLPWFRSLSWSVPIAMEIPVSPWQKPLRYFLVTSNYFFYGETLMEQFGVVINRVCVQPNHQHLARLFSQVDFLPFLVRYHRLISFSLYILGFVWFVLSLVKKYYLRQVK